MPRTRLSLFALAALFLLLAACAPEETPVPVNMAKREDIAIQQDTERITYAYLPQYSHRTSYERHHLLIAYLNRETGLNIEQIFPDTFDEHMKMVGQGKIDISYSNPFVYVQLAQRFGAQAFARIIELDGKKEFRGQIICRRDNTAIRSLKDCRGKRWFAVDPFSAGGYLFGLGHFIDNGIKKEDFVEIAFAPGPGGKSEKVVLGVYAGKYDLGTVREGTLEVIGNKIDVSEIRVLANTRWYPGWVYAARRGLDLRVVEKIKKALLHLHPQDPAHQEILRAASFSGIISSDDAEFEPIRNLVRKVGLDLGQFISALPRP